MRRIAPASTGGHHQALLRMRQAEIVGNLYAERAEHDPDHEGEVKIKECGEQRWPVAGLPE